MDALFIDRPGCVCIELEDARYWGTAEREQQGMRTAYQHVARRLR